MRRVLMSAVAFLVSTSALAITPFEMPWVNHPVRDTKYVSADHPDGVFVLEFAANFCSYCNDNAPNVDRMATDYAAEPRVQVLDVLIDQSDSEIARWIGRHRPNHPVLKDVGRTTWTQVGERYIPTMVVTDCNGEIKFKYTGVWSPSVQRQIKDVVDGLLAGTCEPAAL